MRTFNFPLVNNFDEGDVLLKDGINGTKTILAADAVPSNSDLIQEGQTNKYYLAAEKAVVTGLVTNSATKAELAAAVISGVADGAVTPIKTSFISQSVNLYDYYSRVVGYRLSASYMVGTYDTITATEGYELSNVIPAKPNTNYTITNRCNYDGETVLSMFNSSGIYTGIVNPTVNPDGSRTYTTTSGTYYIRFHARPSVQYPFESTFMLVEGSELPEEYVPYGYIFDSSTADNEILEVSGRTVQNRAIYAALATKENIFNVTTLDAPSYIDLVEGEAVYVYDNGLLNSNDFERQNKYCVVTYGGTQPIPSGAVGNVREKDLTGFAIGTYANQWRLRNAYNAVYEESKDFNAYVRAVPTNPVSVKNILIIGDSLVGSGKPTLYLRQKLDAKSLTNYALVGRNLLEAVRFEAVGGYSWHNYVDNPSILPAGYPNNYFWNTTTGELDISNYMDTYCSSANLDYVVCVLGWNHLVNSVYAADTMDDISALATAFINQVHAEYPSCKILLVGIQKTYNGICANASPYQIRKQWDFCSDLNAVYSAIANNATYSSYVRFMQMSAFFDSQHGHTLTTANNNPYSADDPTTLYLEKMTICSDYIHPNEEVGYKMYADGIWRGLVALTAL